MDAKRQNLKIEEQTVKEYFNEKGMVLEGIVEKTEFPNKGIIFYEGEKVIVKNALEGQKVRFSVNKKEKGERREDSWR